MQTQKIPLDQLKLSPLNVRKTGGTNIADLAASIVSEQGLLQGLVVIPSADKGFEVIAGGRRLRALQQLASDNLLPAQLASEGIPCLVADAARAGSISLAENAIREAMHPADQCDAFVALLAKEPEGEVAARFGVTVSYVRQRLKLANVSPKIIAAFRAGKLTLGQVEAYAVSNDHPHQERVFKSVGENAEPYDIRRRLTQGQVESSDDRVTLAGGLKAYEDAGGAVHRDMFSEAVYLTDVKLLDKLVDQRFKEEKKKLLDAGWSWVEAGLDLREYHFNRASKVDKSKHGAIVCADYNGRLKVITGLLKQGERDSSARAGKGKGKDAKPKNPGELSFAQRQLLQAERTCALRLHLAGSPRVGMAGLAAALLHELLKASSDYSRSADETVRIAQRDKYSDRTPLPTREVMEKSPARKALEAKISEFKKRVTGKNLFAWLLEQPEAVTHEALALAAGAAALTVQMVDGPDNAATFCGLAGLNMANSWAVTPEWLASQPAGYIIAAVAEYRGKESADQVARAKGKAGVVGAAAPLLAGWLPKPLRGPAYVERASGPAPAASAPGAAQKPAKAASKAKAAPKPAKRASKGRAPAKKAAKAARARRPAPKPKKRAKGA